MATEREQLQKMLAELDYYQTQLQVLQQQSQLIDASISDILIADQTLTEIGKLPEGTEILVPIGGSSFIQAKITNTKTVIVGLGADTSTKKTIEDAQKTLQERLSEAQKFKENVQRGLVEISQRIEVLRPQVEELVAKIREASGKPGEAKGSV
ncbi:MAG: prefoldin subunit alpha [Euryarchaeota archaeon]|nr:prefoldin subunit alpha [Euryarchaeota archaeon]